MRIVQFTDTKNQRHVGVVSGDQLRIVRDATSARDLALAAYRAQQSLESFIAARLSDEFAYYGAALRERRVLPPLDHPDLAHMLISGTGLTHLGSAQSRDAMHAKLQDTANMTDSMKMFKLGYEGGKPAAGQVGAQPEWFYKGDGVCIAAPECDIVSPAFAHDGSHGSGEEAEIVGCYVISDDGVPLRVGFALGNEFADHSMERINYLYLAHSKLRSCSFGPELRIGAAPDDIRGSVHIERDGTTLWRGEMLTGEANMTHTIANMEHHHFKYSGFRRAGDVHVHYFGASALSCANGIRTQSGDMFIIECSEFGAPLRNRMVVDTHAEKPVHIKMM
jgi:hypothetical protein